MRPTMEEMRSQLLASGLHSIAPAKGPGPKGGKYYVEPRGYAAIPGTGPAGETCGSCAHMVRRRLGGVYRKCGLMRAQWTGGAKTDIKATSPACSRWEAA
jgi:hypothetical protein